MRRMTLALLLGIAFGPGPLASAAQSSRPGAPRPSRPSAGRPAPQLPALGVSFPAPGLPAAVPAPHPAARLESLAEAAAAPLETARAAASPAETGAAAGEELLRVLQGGQIRAGSALEAGEAVLGAQTLSGLSASGGSSGFVGPRGPAAPPPSERGPRVSDSRAGYALRAWALSAIARLWGIEASLPPAGERLLGRALEEASGKRVVFADFDHTLGPYAGHPEPGNAAALIRGLRRGKQAVIISDRPVFSDGSSQKSIEFSLSSLPAEQLEGLMIAGKKDGVIAVYKSGKLQELHRETGFSEEQARAVAEAAAAVKARLGSAALHDGSKGIPVESLSGFSYGLMLRAGTPVETVIAAAAALEAELRARGLAWEVKPRLAKDAHNPPYVTFAKIDKSWAVAEASRRLGGVSAAEGLIIGDSFFEPAPARPLGGLRRLTAPAARRLAERLSGGPIPATGNATDADMEKGLPGALTLAVGGSASPRLGRAYATAGGPAATERALARWAEGPHPAPAGVRPVTRSWEYSLRRRALAALFALTGLRAPLPVPAGAAYQDALAQAAEKRALLSDVDETLAPNSGQIPRAHAARLGSLLKRGKTVALITMRPSLEAGPRDTTVIQSLEHLPEAERAGLWLVTLKDGFILRYDAAGRLQVIERAEPFTSEQKAAFEEAARAAAERLSGEGIGFKFSDAGALSFGFILQAGLSREQVLRAKRVLGEELAPRGLGNFPLNHRYPADPTREPYLTVQKIDKVWAAGRLAQLAGVSASEALLQGDSFYDPESARPAPLSRLAPLLRPLARRLSGRALPERGNDADRDMERALPGALSFGYGGVDPDVSHGYALPEWRRAALDVLEAMDRPLRGPSIGESSIAVDGERRRKGPEERKPSRAETAATVIALILMAAASAAAWYMIISGFAELVAIGEAQLRSGPFDPFEPF